MSAPMCSFCHRNTAPAEISGARDGLGLSAISFTLACKVVKPRSNREATASEPTDETEERVRPTSTRFRYPMVKEVWK